MIRLVVTSISVMALIIGIAYLTETYAVQTTTPVDLGATQLLCAADEAEGSSGDEEKKEDEAPGIDRIACSVCYG